jgi:hypothetical protein
LTPPLIHGKLVLSPRGHPTPPAPEQPHTPGKQHIVVRRQPLTTRHESPRGRQNVAVFAVHFATSLPFLAVSCRFCHPQRAMSRSLGRQTGLNAASERMMPLIHHQKAAKTAMLTAAVNIATWIRRIHP